MNTLRKGVRWLALALPIVALSCEGGGLSDDPELGSADIALTQVPADVQCIHIVAQGTSRTREQFFDVMAGAGMVLRMNRLPTGTVQFSGDAFAVACAGAGMAVPNFISDPVTVQVNPGEVASVTLVMLRNGRADISVDFEGECQQAGGNCAASGGFTCCGGLACDAMSLTCRPPVFADITAIFAQSCVGCHNGTNTRINLMADADLYTRLTTPMPATVPTCAGETLIMAGNPAGSFLLTKIAAMPPCGNRMPLRCDAPGSTRSCLPDVQVQLITAWIAGGASP